VINDPTKPPEALLKAIARDLSPVKPSPLPFPLILRMAPLAVTVASLILLLIGVRRDHEVLGPLLTWGASVAQLCLAIVLVWMAAHESTPANRLPKNVVYFVAAATALVVVAVTWLTFLTSPASGPFRVSPLVMGIACGIGSTIAGGILVGLFCWVFRNSLTTRPAIAGALYGAGAGVAINASWRLACPVSTPWHALGAHGMAVIATAILGALAGRILAARRQSPSNQSGSAIRK
jgi:hypothetical protein